MTENKKPPFDLLNDCIIEHSQRCANTKHSLFCYVGMAEIIKQSICKAQREAVMEVLDELLKREHTSCGSDDFFEGIEHSRKLIKAEINRIRAKYQGEK